MSIQPPNTSPAMPEKSRMARFFRSPLFPIFMIVFVDVLGVGITIPVLPLYAQQVFSASATQITLLVSVYFTAQFIASPILGRLSDRVGRRPVLIVSQIGSLVALLLSGVAPALIFLYLARTIDGLTGGNISVAQAYLSDITEEKDRARGMGIINAAFSSGFIFGPAFGGLVAAQLGPRAPFFMAAGVAVVTISLSYFMLPESRKPRPEGEDDASAARPRQPTGRKARREATSALLSAPGVSLILLVAFGGQFAFFNFQSTFVLWAEAVIFTGRDPRFIQQAVGGILTFVGLFGIATQVWLVGPLVKRFGERLMVSAGLSVRALSFILMSFFPYAGMALMATPLLSIGGGISRPALIALLTFSAPREQQGHAIGLMEAAMGMGRIIGPLVGGAVFQYVSPNAPNAVAAVLLSLTVLASLGFRRMRAGERG